MLSDVGTFPIVLVVVLVLDLWTREMRIVELKVSENREKRETKLQRCYDEECKCSAVEISQRPKIENEDDDENEDDWGVTDSGLYSYGGAADTPGPVQTSGP